LALLVLLRALLVLRAPAALFRLTAALRFRLTAALRFRLPPAFALPLRLMPAARFVFFLPRGGIVLLCELGSPTAAGERKSATRDD